MLFVLVVLVGWVLFGWAGEAQASCPESLSTAQLSLSLEDAEAAFAAVEVETFQVVMDRIAASVPCLDGLVSVDQAARYHRLQGMRAWVLGDEHRAQRAFLGARRLEPAWRFPAHMVPEQHPTRISYLALPLDQVIEQPVAVPPGVRLWIDGRLSSRRAEGAPGLVQVQEETGSLRASAYVWPGEALPQWPGDVQTLEAPVRRSRARLPLLLTSVTATAGSATMLVLAGASHGRWEDPATPVEELDGLRDRTNGLLIGAGGAALLAIGAGVGVTATF